MAGGQTKGADLGLLILRLALGAVFVLHGLGKILPGLPDSEPPGIQGFSDYLAGLGIPMAYYAAIAAIVAEIGGGLVVILGLGGFTRLAALALAFTMGVAIYAHFGNGFFMARSVEQPGMVPNGYEYNVALLAMSLCLVFTGPGKIALLGKGGGGGKGKG